ncbi:hypothetical protein DH09_08115 [Bacillaceae bacterium JMAK1]|nr:hypothetical protein DH09_08115 [Bacillaceae bacterium JMAK1]
MIENNEIVGCSVDDNTIQLFENSPAPEGFSLENWFEWYLEDGNLIHDKSRFEQENLVDGLSQIESLSLALAESVELTESNKLEMQLAMAEFIEFMGGEK